MECIFARSDLSQRGTLSWDTELLTVLEAWGLGRFTEELASVRADSCLLAGSSHQRERAGFLSCFYNPTMTSSKPHYLPKTPSPNTTTREAGLQSMSCHSHDSSPQKSAVLLYFTLLTGFGKQRIWKPSYKCIFWLLLFKKSQTTRQEIHPLFLFLFLYES